MDSLRKYVRSFMERTGLNRNRWICLLCQRLRRVTNLPSKVRVRVRRIIMDTIFRVAWSASLSVVSAVLLTVIARVLLGSNLSLDLVTTDLGQLFPSLFSVFLIIIFSMYLISFTQTISEPKIFHKASLKIRSLSLETRHWLAQAFKWTTLCFFLVLLVLMFFVMLETVQTRIVPYSSFLWFLGIYACCLIFLTLMRSMMHRLDWIIYHFEEFMKTKEPENLQKALKNYNRVLDSTLSWTRLLAISQYIHEAFKIGTESERNELDRRIAVIVYDLNHNSICGADEELVDLSSLSKELLKDHKKVLGFEVRYPFRLRTWQRIRLSFAKALSELMLAVFWIFLFWLLAYFKIIPVIFPSTL
jgi:hypothetical protein